jgi:shikimate kinase
LGKLCADKLSLPFYDTDQMIEAHYGCNKTVKEIWQEIGELLFRSLETEVIFSLKREPSIIAIGGGSLLREQNRAHLNELGLSIYLKVSFPILYKRIAKWGFPVHSDRFEKSAHERIPIYESHCKYIIETENLAEKEAVDLLLQFYEQ